MILIPVKSDAIKEVGYEAGLLAVRFHSSDTIYKHRGVPFTLVLGFMAAKSKGAYYTKKIRGKY